MKKVGMKLLALFRQFCWSVFREFSSLFRFPKCLLYFAFSGVLVRVGSESKILEKEII